MLGWFHTEEFKKNRSGKLNPMYNKEKSKEFIYMQTKDKSGANNPQFGVIKSQETINKISKFVYVYKGDEFVGQFKTVECKKHFKIGYDTLKKYKDTNKPYKNITFYSNKKE